MNIIWYAIHNSYTSDISSPCWQSIWKIRNELLSYLQYKEKDWICRVRPGFTPKPFTIVSTCFNYFHVHPWMTENHLTRPIQSVKRFFERSTTSQYVTITGKMLNYAKLPTHCGVKSREPRLSFSLRKLRVCHASPEPWTAGALKHPSLVMELWYALSYYSNSRSISLYFSQIPYLWRTLIYCIQSHSIFGHQFACIAVPIALASLTCFGSQIKLYATVVCETNECE